MDYKKIQKDLIENYIKPAGVKDKKVLDAFYKIPRHEFIKEPFKSEAYIDAALPIGEGQTISQPSLVGLMTQALSLKGSKKVLEIGTGSGFQAAILSTIAKEVYTVEVIESLAQSAKKTLYELGIKNVHVHVANGSLGLPKNAPYDAIIVTAAALKMPKQLKDQLKEGGTIVIPLETEEYFQSLMVGVKKKGKLKLEELEPVAFVPLVGKYLKNPI
jgi:protein-L-isoaspartate(D-aspartate) O-methyltransferase